MIYGLLRYHELVKPWLQERLPIISLLVLTIIFSTVSIRGNV
ncbi:hypothetical protein MICAI_680027 [Microcystis sp. T1-4]|nr:hypothetical protein MICAI_680027 [Microcystis sp. T1-4]